MPIELPCAYPPPIYNKVDKMVGTPEVKTRPRIGKNGKKFSSVMTQYEGPDLPSMDDFQVIEQPFCNTIHFPPGTGNFNGRY